MASPTLTIKRQNHRIHPCEQKLKNKLLNILITQNSGKNILIVTATGPLVLEDFPAVENVFIRSDSELTEAAELRCDLLISYDLPADAIVYMARLARTDSHAVILLDRSEQTQLYPIERLLGRSIRQEIITGFEPLIDTMETKRENDKEFRREKREQRDERPPRDDRPRKDDRARRDDKRSDKRPYESNKRDDKRTDRKPYDNDKRDDRRPARKPYESDAKKPESRVKKSSGASRYIGKDENGKPMFSGKSGERNHGYDGKPKEAQDRAKSKPARNDKDSGERASFENKKKDAPYNKSSFSKSRSYDTKEQKKPYEKTSNPSSKPFSNAKPSSPKRAPRTFRVQAEKGTRSGK